VPAKKLEPPTVSYPSGSAKIGNASWNLSGAIFPKGRVVGVSQAVALNWKTLEVLIIKRDGVGDSCSESKLLSAQPSGSSFEDILLAQLRSHGIVHKDSRLSVKETTWDTDLRFDGMVDQFVEDIGQLYTPALRSFYSFFLTKMRLGTPPSKPLLTAKHKLRPSAVHGTSFPGPLPTQVMLVTFPSSTG
jgi:hypothetical protein